MKKNDLSAELFKIAKELSDTQKRYRIFFNNKLKEWEINDASELSEEDKKKFFNEIEKEWTEDED